MTTEADFLRALTDEADDPNLRLVFADWLEDRADFRAEFVRVTAELDAWEPDLARRTRLQERLALWWQQHGQQWLEPLRPFVNGQSLDRGLLRLRMTPAQFADPAFAERAPELFARCWVRTVSLENVPAWNLRGVLRQPHLGLVSRLEIEGADMEDGKGRALVSSPRLAGVRELSVANNRLTEETLTALLTGPAAEGLRRVDFRNNRVTRAVLPRQDGLVLDLDGNLAAEGQPQPEREPGNRVTNSLGMRFTRIPAGTFLMGSPFDELYRYADEGPRRAVTLTRPFYLGTYPVFHRQFSGPFPDGPLWTPVTGISFEQALDCCAFLSALPEERAQGRSYRLPTEAEWEHACRAGTTTAFCWGDTATSHQANFDGNYPHGPLVLGPYLDRTSVVGSYAANPFGLFDMHGNVWEWVADWFDPYYYEVGPDTDPTGPVHGDKHILRGGSWYHQGRCCRSSYRLENDPGEAYRGLRLVLEIN